MKLVRFLIRPIMSCIIFFLMTLTVPAISGGATYSPMLSSKGDLEIHNSQGTRPFEQPKSKPKDWNNSRGNVELQDFPLNDSSEEKYSDMGQLNSVQHPKANTITQSTISTPKGQSNYVEYEPESKPKRKMDYVEPNIESELERKTDYVEYSPEFKPKHLTNDQKKPTPNQKQTTLNQKPLREPRVSQTVDLEFSKHRVEESYRLLGKEAEIAQITRYYGFINTTCRKQKVNKFISFVEHQRKKYEIYELDMKKFNKLPPDELADTCEHYINNNVVLRQQGISFDRSEDPDSVKVVRKKLNFSIKRPSRKIRVIGCPCKNTNFDKTMLYVIPVLYIDETQDSYLFVFKDDKTNPNTSDDIKLEMLSRVKENSVPNVKKQKPTPADENEKSGGFLTFLSNRYHLWRSKIRE